MKVIAQNGDGDLFIEKERGEGCSVSSQFLVPEENIISELKLRLAHTTSRFYTVPKPLRGSDDNEMAYFKGAEQGYEIFTAINIIDKTENGNLAFHINQNNVRLKQCLAFSGYSKLKILGANDSNDAAIVEAMDTAPGGTGKIPSGELIPLCAKGDYFLIPDKQLDPENTEETSELIGTRAYYTDVENSTIRTKHDLCNIFGIEVTVLMETGDIILVQTEGDDEKCVDYLVLEKAPHSLSFPVNNYH